MVNPQAPHTLIFDADNTLFPSEQAVMTYVDRLQDSLGSAAGLPSAEVADGLYKVFAEHGLFDLKKTLKHHPLLKRAAGGDPGKAFAAQIDAAEAAFAAAIKPSVQTVKALEKLKAAGYRMVVYSEGSASDTLFKLKSAGLDGIAERVYGPGSYGGSSPLGRQKTGDSRLFLMEPFPKSDPNNFLKIVADLYPDMAIDKAKKLVTVIGDNVVRDIAAAERVGLKGIWARQFKNSYSLAKLKSGLRKLKAATRMMPGFEKLIGSHIIGKFRTLVYRPDQMKKLADLPSIMKRRERPPALVRMASANTR